MSAFLRGSLWRKQLSACHHFQCRWLCQSSAPPLRIPRDSTPPKGYDPQRHKGGLNIAVLTSSISASQFDVLVVQLLEWVKPSQRKAAWNVVETPSEKEEKNNQKGVLTEVSPNIVMKRLLANTRVPSGWVDKVTSNDVEFFNILPFMPVEIQIEAEVENLAFHCTTNLLAGVAVCSPIGEVPVYLPVVSKKEVTDAVRTWLLVPGKGVVFDSAVPSLKSPVDMYLS